MPKAELRRIPFPIGPGLFDLPMPKDAWILDVLEPKGTVLNAALLIYWPWDQPEGKRTFTVLEAGIPFEDTTREQDPRLHQPALYLGRYRSKNSEFYVFSGEWR